LGHAVFGIDGIPLPVALQLIDFEIASHGECYADSSCRCHGLKRVICRLIKPLLSLSCRRAFREVPQWQGQCAVSICMCQCVYEALAERIDEARRRQLQVRSSVTE